MPTAEAPKRRRRAKTPEQRFWSKVDRSGDCWVWTAYRNELGYGKFGLERRIVKAHRFAYELLVGPIPDGLVLDHLCRNPSCVNPAHLEPVTQRENLLRGTGFSGVNARKTRCPQGHKYTPDNTHLDKNGWRECRICMRERKRKVAA